LLIEFYVPRLDVEASQTLSFLVLRLRSNARLLFDPS